MEEPSKRSWCTRRRRLLVSTFAIAFRQDDTLSQSPILREPLIDYSCAEDKAPGILDLFFAATVGVHDLTVLTLYVRHFVPLEIPLVNTFESQPPDSVDHQSKRLTTIPDNLREVRRQCSPRPARQRRCAQIWSTLFRCRPTPQRVP